MIILFLAILWYALLVGLFISVSLYWWRAYQRAIDEDLKDEREAEENVKRLADMQAELAAEKKRKAIERSKIKAEIKAKEKLDRKSK